MLSPSFCHNHRKTKGRVLLQVVEICFLFPVKFLVGDATSVSITCSSLIWKTYVKDSFEQQTLLILDGAQIDCVLLLFNNIVFIDRVVIFGSQSSQISSPKTPHISSLLTYTYNIYTAKLPWRDAEGGQFRQNPKWYIFLYIYEDIPLTREFRCTSILAFVKISLRT